MPSRPPGCGASHVSGDALLAAASRELRRGIETSRRVGGGDINDAWALDLDDGTSAFLKSRPDAPADEYGAEAAGLEWLSAAGGLQVPEVLAVLDEPGARGLLLAWIEPGRLDRDGEEELGRGLALVHRAGAKAFDALPPRSPRSALRFGGVELPLGSVPAGSPWSAHYGTRLELLSRVAMERGQIGVECAQLLTGVIERMDELAGPAEPPARVHGDLWSGNVLAGAHGRPWMIDPAAHGAHRELDLAMLDLFGTVTRRTLAAYEEVEPLAQGHLDRRGLWQLQPLLVHAILFGGSYGAAAERVAGRYR
ncbi:MAG: fructosamine kinase family protein [Solirubrobacterales bacterium]|nr:fructosamine kinase family protein [Solirubrobacterales bacterium]